MERVVSLVLRPCAKRVLSMATTTKPRFRKTRDSVVTGDLEPPYDVLLAFHKFDDGLIHSCGWIKGASSYITCCRINFGPTLVVYDGPSCLKCAIYRGCPACVLGYIHEETVRLGKWETKDGRRLYVFEMDDQHLRNSIAKLTRDEDTFKKDWKEWLVVLHVEAKLRGFE
jgi:hypothetical protein